jgi:hypothetical protein
MFIFFSIAGIDMNEAATVQRLYNKLPVQDNYPVKCSNKF